MRSLTFDEVFAILSAVRWSAAELARLRAWLAGAAHPDECIALIEQAARGRPCPHCRCPRSQRCGQASGLQRFRCLGCRRSYNALTGTPLARLRKKERWLDYLQCVLESRTVREAASIAGVHRTTSFRWRHRFVPGAVRDRPPLLTAIVEADETYRLESQKGSRSLTRPPRLRGGVATRRGINREHDCLLVARDRSGRTLDFHTDVNGWHSRFKTWLVRFRGVASHYLSNYSGWQRLLDARQLTTPAKCLCAAARPG